MSGLSTQLNCPQQTAQSGEQSHCHVCGRICSGTDLIVSSVCRACYVFFRRSRSSTYKCLRSERCKIDVYTRNSCRRCRYLMCVKAGLQVYSAEQSAELSKPTKVTEETSADEYNRPSCIVEYGGACADRCSSTPKSQQYSGLTLSTDLLSASQKLILEAPLAAFPQDTSGIFADLLRSRTQCSSPEKDTNDKPSSDMKLWNPTTEGLALGCSFVVSHVHDELEKLKLNCTVTSLPLQDQISLLRGFMMQSYLLEDLRRSQASPGVIILRDGVHFAKFFTGFPKDRAAYHLFHNVLAPFQHLDPDTTEYGLLRMIAFWNPSICSKESAAVVRQNQVAHIIALENYLRNCCKIRTGRQGTALTFLQSLESYATFFRNYIAQYAEDPLVVDLLAEEESFPKPIFRE